MPNEIQLGHALRVSNDDWAGNTPILTKIAAEALRLATGKEKLVARAPAPEFKVAVEHAERQIGIDPHDPTRPVYAYIGDLHAHLGQVGLVFHREWARRCLHGFTRCDSGGMVGGFGNFKYTNSDPQYQSASGRVWSLSERVKALAEPPPDSERDDPERLAQLAAASRDLELAKQDLELAKAERDRAVRSLTVLEEEQPDVVAVLDAELAAELEAAHAPLSDCGKAYVDSLWPEMQNGFDARYMAALEYSHLRPEEKRELAYAHAPDPRRLCVEGALASEADQQDRRPWTWEVRMSDSPEQDDLCAVLLSLEAAKGFLDARLEARLAGSVPVAPREGSGSHNTIQTQAPELPDHVQIITADANPTTKTISGHPQHTGSAPWFYSDEARAALRRCSR